MLDNPTIRYTLDGSEPTSRSLIYKGALPINLPTNLRAKMYKTGWTPSEIKTAFYRINQAQPPYLDLADGDYNFSPMLKIKYYKQEGEPPIDRPLPPILTLPVGTYTSPQSLTIISQ